MKKLLCLLLSVVCIFGLLPSIAFASTAVQPAGASQAGRAEYNPLLDNDTNLFFNLSEAATVAGEPSQSILAGLSIDSAAGNGFVAVSIGRLVALAGISNYNMLPKGLNVSIDLSNNKHPSDQVPQVSENAANFTVDSGLFATGKSNSINTFANRMIAARNEGRTNSALVSFSTTPNKLSIQFRPRVTIVTPVEIPE